MRDLQLEFGHGDVRLWRNQAGLCWAGESHETPGGAIVIPNARRVMTGLAPGASDLIGPVSVVITQAMVGQRVALFGAVEVKTLKEIRRPKPKKQVAFVNLIKEMGGRAGFASTRDEAAAILGVEM